MRFNLKERKNALFCSFFAHLLRVASFRSFVLETNDSELKTVNNESGPNGKDNGADTINY